METQTDLGALENTREVSGKVRKPRAKFWRGTWEQENQGMVSKSPAELTWQTCPQPEPAPHCLLHLLMGHFGDWEDNSVCMSWGQSMLFCN